MPGTCTGPAALSVNSCRDATLPIDLVPDFNSAFMFERVGRCWHLVTKLQRLGKYSMRLAAVGNRAL
jgi:hypothetical protein